MRDVLYGGTGQPAQLPITSPDVQAVGFDQITIGTLLANDAVNIGGLTHFGTLVVYTVPQRIDHAELRELAVHGHPEGRFQTAAWWQLQIEEGATQEILFDSEIQTTLNTQMNPPRTSGFQYGRYGSLHRPLSVYAALRQGQRLVLPVFGDASYQRIDLTVYVRVRGLIYSAAQ